MPESFYDTVVLLFFTVIPLILILLQWFLSTKKLAWGFVIPAIWSAFGIWMLIAGRGDDVRYSFELFLFFLGGDVLLLGILSLIKYLKKVKIKK